MLLFAAAVVIRDAVAYGERPQAWGLAVVGCFAAALAVAIWSPRTPDVALVCYFSAMFISPKMKRRSLYGPGAEAFLQRLRARVEERRRARLQP